MDFQTFIWLLLVMGGWVGWAGVVGWGWLGW